MNEKEDTIGLGGRVPPRGLGGGEDPVPQETPEADDGAKKPKEKKD